MGSVFSFVGALNHRFVSTIWLPVQVFVVAVICSTTDWRALLASWWSTTPAEQVTVAVAVVAITTVGAHVFAILLPAISGIFEGRWRGPLRFAIRQAENQERRRLDKLKSGSPDRVIMAFPPAPHAVAPTALGNALRSVEWHPWVRYRLDSIVSWPRLYEALPDRTVRNIADEKALLDLTITLTALSSLYGAVASVAAAVDSRWWTAAALLGAGIVLSRLFYGVSVRAAISYGQVIRAAYDVHRFTVLDALGWERPSSWTEERRQWEAVTTLWLRGTPPTPEAAAALGYPGESTPRHHAHPPMDAPHRTIP